MQCIVLAFLLVLCSGEKSSLRGLTKAQANTSNPILGVWRGMQFFGIDTTGPVYVLEPKRHSLSRMCRPGYEKIESLKECRDNVGLHLNGWLSHHQDRVHEFPKDCIEWDTKDGVNIARVKLLPGTFGCTCAAAVDARAAVCVKQCVTIAHMDQCRAHEGCTWDDSMGHCVQGNAPVGGQCHDDHRKFQQKRYEQTPGYIQIESSIAADKTCQLGLSCIGFVDTTTIEDSSLWDLRVTWGTCEKCPGTCLHPTRFCTQHPCSKGLVKKPFAYKCCEKLPPAGEAPNDEICCETPLLDVTAPKGSAQGGGI